MEKEVTIITVNENGVIADRTKINPKDKKNLAYALTGLLLHEYYVFGRGILLTHKNKLLINVDGEKNIKFDKNRKTYDDLQLCIENNKYVLKDQCRYLSRPEISHIINLIYEEEEKNSDENGKNVRFSLHCDLWS